MWKNDDDFKPLSKFDKNSIKWQGGKTFAIQKGAVSQKYFLHLRSILQWNLSRIQEVKRLERDKCFFPSQVNLSTIGRRKRGEGGLSAKISDDDFDKI